MMHVSTNHNFDAFANNVCNDSWQQEFKQTVFGNIAIFSYGKEVDKVWIAN